MDTPHAAAPLPHAPAAPDDWTIERTGTIDAPTRQAMFDLIDGFNDAATQRPEPSRKLAVLVREAGAAGKGAVLGGAWAVSYYDWLHIDLLYLPETMRGQGWGSRIMRAIEREAIRRGCVGVWVETLGFQAPEFYPRFGYERFAEIGDFLAGHARIWFRKTALSGGPVDGGLDIDGDPDPADREVLERELLGFSDAIIGPANRRRLALLLRDPASGALGGGLLARMGRGWMFVELLVLPDDARRRGLGSRLLGMAEAAAAEHGCRGVWLDTFSWQARPFYEKLGYRAIGTLPDYPAPHSRTLLAKRLDGLGW
jgi:GNAT superfamily N-acetyltransferase